MSDPKPSRRHYLGTSAAMLGLALCPRRAQATAPPADYPRQRLLKLPPPGSSEPFFYPGPSDLCVLVRLKHPLATGAGATKDLVAFAARCPHRGRQLDYDSERQLIGPCSWHLSAFDPERAGRMVQGQASQDLPQVLLQTEGDEVFAVGITGLLYQKVNNLDACPAGQP